MRLRTGKWPLRGSVPGGYSRVLREQYAHRGNVLIEPPVLRGIDHVHPAAEYGRCQPSGAQRAPLGRRVDAAGHTGDDQRSLLRHLIAELLRHRHAVGRTRASADDGNRRLLVKQRQRAAPVEQHRRIVDPAQAVWVGRVLHREDELLLAGALLQHALGAVERLVAQQLRLRAGHPLGQQKLLRVRVVDVLRRLEMLQKQEPAAAAQPRQGCQPCPEFQRCHRPHLPAV